MHGKDRGRAGRARSHLRIARAHYQSATPSGRGSATFLPAVGDVLRRRAGRRAVYAAASARCSHRKAGNRGDARASWADGGAGARNPEDGTGELMTIRTLGTL